MNAPSRLNVVTSMAKNFQHRELHDLAARTGVSQLEREAILVAMKQPDRKSGPKQTRAIKSRRPVKA